MIEVYLQYFRIIRETKRAFKRGYEFYKTYEEIYPKTKELLRKKYDVDEYAVTTYIGKKEE